MAADTDALVAELVGLGRDLPMPEVGAGLATAVLGRIAEAPAPAPARGGGVGAGLRRLGEATRRHRRRTAAAVVAVLLSLLAAPPVRAAVADWFGFAGVRVERGDGPAKPSAPPPPTVEPGLTLDQAARLIGFTPATPAALGAPDGVEVSADHRLLSLSWSGGTDGTVRLDEFDAQLDYTFAKTAPGVEFVAVAGDFALWFDEPHDVVVLNPDGSRRTESARLAGHTLIWMHGGTTMRLEGDLTEQRALEIAASVPRHRADRNRRRHGGVPAAPDPRRPPCAGAALP